MPKRTVYKRLFEKGPERTQRYHSAPPAYPEKSNLNAKTPAKYVLHKITSHFSSENTKYFIQIHMAIQLLTIAVIPCSYSQAE